MKALFLHKALCCFILWLLCCTLATDISGQRKLTKRDKQRIEFTASQQTNQQKAKDDITLVVTGEGTNKEEATANALRSAIEQAFGTFVSANTTILNDELVKDEIVSISTGNIKNYKELSYTNMGGRAIVSLAATVSIGKLVSYAQSHGASAEFAGQTFMMEMKMRDLNKENEAKALGDFLEKTERVSYTFYDCGLKVGTPRQVSLANINNLRGVENSYTIPLEIGVSATESFYQWAGEFSMLIKSLLLTDEECNSYKESNLEMSIIDASQLGKYINGFSELKGYLRNNQTFISKFVRKIIKEMNSYVDDILIVEKSTRNKYSFVYDGKRIAKMRETTGFYCDVNRMHKDNIGNYVFNWMTYSHNSPSKSIGEEKFYIAGRKKSGEPEFSGLDTYPCMFHTDTSVVHYYKPKGYIIECESESSKISYTLFANLAFGGNELKTITGFEVMLKPSDTNQKHVRLEEEMRREEEEERRRKEEIDWFLSH